MRNLDDSKSAFKAFFICSSKGWGGLEMNVLNLARWLRQRHWQIEIMVAPNTRLASHASQVTEFVHEINWGSKWFYQRSAGTAAGIIDERGTDVIFVCDNKDIAFCGAIKKKCEQKPLLIYQQHMQIGVNKRDLVHTLRYKALDAWISPLNWLKEEVIRKTRYPAHQIHVIPLGTEIGRFTTATASAEQLKSQLGLQLDTPLLVIAGRIDRQKGQLVVAKALKNLLNRDIQAQLLVIGDLTPGEEDATAYFEELNTYVAENLVDRAVIQPATKGIADVMLMADILVLASKGETYGMVTIEAMLTGTPVVATNSGGSPEILQQGKLGWLYEPHNESALADTLEQILGNYNKALDMAGHAQQQAKARYSHELECQEIENLVRTLSSNG